MEVIHKAKPGTKVKGRISVAEAAGIKALTADVNRIQHERRQLAMKDQELAEELEVAIEEYQQGWRGIAERHGFDPNVPAACWTLNKKGRVTLDSKCHPDKTPTKAPEPGEGAEENNDGGDESAADGATPEESPGSGDARTPRLVGGDADKAADDDGGPPP
jgi:hypothetical protein